MSTHNQNIDHLFRHQFGRMVSSLVRKFGIDKLDLIENAVMDSFYKAIKTWAFKGAPQSPQAWLYKVATNSLLDCLRNKNHQNFDVDAIEFTLTTDTFDAELDLIIHDDQLKLIFYCCHPTLKPVDQIAFTLKTISGFGNSEIANALLISLETLKKRLARARRTLRSVRLGQNLLNKTLLANRLENVHHSLYLLFNEGFYSNHKDFTIRKELCVEAMRLVKMICDNEIANSNSFALMALMCYHSSRIESRTNDHGATVLIKDQDRSIWNRFLIGKAHHYLYRSTSGGFDNTIYQLEAIISAQHCMAATFDDTNWVNLVKLYIMLYQLKPQNEVLLNLILVHAYNGNLPRAQALYNQIDRDTINHLALYYAVGAQLYEFLQKPSSARAHWLFAAKHARTEREEQFYNAKVANDSVLK